MSQPMTGMIFHPKTCHPPKVHPLVERLQRHATGPGGDGRPGTQLVAIKKSSYDHRPSYQPSFIHINQHINHHVNISQHVKPAQIVIEPSIIWDSFWSFGPILKKTQVAFRSKSNMPQVCNLAWSEGELISTHGHLAVDPIDHLVKHGKPETTHLTSMIFRHFHGDVKEFSKKVTVYQMVVIKNIDKKQCIVLTV